MTGHARERIRRATRAQRGDLADDEPGDGAEAHLVPARVREQAEQRDNSRAVRQRDRIEAPELRPMQK